VKSRRVQGVARQKSAGSRIVYSPVAQWTAGRGASIYGKASVLDVELKRAVVWKMTPPFIQPELELQRHAKSGNGDQSGGKMIQGSRDSD